MKRALVVFLIPLILQGAEISVKNFRELYESLLVSTNLNPSTELSAAFNNVKDTLPKFGRIDEVNSSMQMSLTILGSTFCKVMMDKDKALTDANRWIFSGVDFTKGPDVIDDTLKGVVAERLSQVFWQRKLEMQEKATLVSLMKTLAGTSVATKDVDEMFLLTCTAFTTSPDFFVM